MNPEAESIYSRKVAEYFAHPANAGIPAGDPAEIFSGEAGERAQGVQVVFRMRASGEEIAEIRFQAFGCPHTIAACSLATERLTGVPVRDLLEMTAGVLLAALDVPVEKMGRMLVVQDALQNCFRAWDNKGVA